MIPADLAQPGTAVSYEDQANPRRVGTVMAVLTKCPACTDGVVRQNGHPRAGRACVLCGGTGDRITGTEYEVEWEDGERTTSDLRQHGWNLVAGADAGPFAGADIISIYTRKQAIEDGALVDISELASEAGIRFPTAMTRAAWADCVEWSHGGVQDETGRLWDVVWMTRNSIVRARGRNPVTVELLRIPNQPDAQRATKAELVAVCGPGDTAEPVITLMLPGED